MGSTEVIPIIPIVDLKEFSTAPLTLRLKTAQKLVAACEEIGFVYITGHGVSDKTLAQAFKVSKTFYGLPTEQKMKAPHPPGWAVHRGYSWPGLEKVSAAISDIDDLEVVNQLREVQDLKARLIYCGCASLTSARKAMKLAASKIKINQTCGHPTTSYPNGALS